MRRWLFCHRCGHEMEIAPAPFGCPKCRSGGELMPLEVGYDYDDFRPKVDEMLTRGHHEGVWRFRELLPLEDESKALTLGEGSTPLTKVRTLCEATGLSEIYVKNETVNPTWAFKDRFNAVNVSMARQLGYDKVVTTSTGNHGASTAAYAAAGDLRCVVICPYEAAPLGMDLIKFYGADLVVTPWSEGGMLMESMVRDHGWFASTMWPVSPVSTPFGVEGYKTIGYEIALAFRDRTLNHVFCPAGGGDGIYGNYKGFSEFRDLGIVDGIPRFHGCQARGSNPLIRSMRQGGKAPVTLKFSETVATSIRGESTGSHAMWAIQESGGEAIELTDGAIVEAVSILGRGGIAVEPASASSVAGAIRAARQGKLRSDDRVVCVVTGTLIKWPNVLTHLVPETSAVGPNLEELGQVVDL
jgi:threonine synthase